MDEKDKSKVIQWLLEDDNPAVQYRTKTEILNVKADKNKVIEWVFKFTSADWKEYKWIKAVYQLVAFSECGLTAEDIPMDKEEIIRYGSIHLYRHGCGDFLNLLALIRLGLANEPVVAEVIKRLPENLLPDGGYLCAVQLKKKKHIPKSCVKANMLALMICAECKKRNIKTDIEKKLIDYFWNHNLFYRTNTPQRLILDVRAGWRTIDTFYPFEAMRVGLQNIVEAFCALGYGNDDRLNEAWGFINSKKNTEGQVILNGTLSKPLLPKERVGKPSKWVTFYTLLAEKEKLGV